YTHTGQPRRHGGAALGTVRRPPANKFSTEGLRVAEQGDALGLLEKIAAAAKGPTTLIDEAGRETPVKGVDELLHAALERSRAGATFQRYKGLGEMNPEQLWETTMNPETRTLLNETMEDAVGGAEMVE